MRVVYIDVAGAVHEYMLAVRSSFKGQIPGIRVAAQHLDAGLKIKEYLTDIFSPKIYAGMAGACRRRQHERLLGLLAGRQKGACSNKKDQASEHMTKRQR